VVHDGISYPNAHEVVRFIPKGSYGPLRKSDADVNPCSRTTAVLAHRSTTVNTVVKKSHHFDLLILSFNRCFCAVKSYATDGNRTHTKKTILAQNSEKVQGIVAERALSPVWGFVKERKVRRKFQKIEP